MKTAAILLLPLCAALAQDDLAAGRQFTAALRLEQQADAALFRSVGIERAEKLLMAVVSRGQSADATTADWANLHRALDGIIELQVEKKDLLKASIFASLQSTYYSNYERDAKSALAASRLSLELHQRSGVVENLDLSWAAVGRSLMSSGDAAAAIEYFLQARLVNRDPFSKLAGRNWRDIVGAYIAMGKVPDARRESIAFLETTRTAPPEVRQSALLAMSDLLVEEKDFTGALARLKEAREAGADAWELTSRLLTCVLLSMRSLNYDEAVQLATRMEAGFPGLPISIPAFARNAIMVRRRMAGDIDGVLRAQLADLEAARNARNISAQIELLRGVAVTYRAGNSLTNQTTTLEQALELERGLPSRSPSSLLFTLNTLGDTYIQLRETAKAHKVFDEVKRMVDAMPDASGRSQSASAYAEALLGKASAAELDDDSDTARDILKAALIGRPQAARFSRMDVLWQAARLERSENMLPAAKQYYEQAIAAAGEVRNLPAEVALRVEYGHFLALNSNRIPGAASIAERQITHAATLAAALNMAESRWRTAYELGILAESAGDRARAQAYYDDAIAKVESMRAALALHEQRQALVDNEAVQDLYRRALALAAGNDARAWDLLERAKAKSFQDGLQGKRFGGNAAAEPALAAIADLEKRIAALRVEGLPENAELLRGAGRAPAVARAEMLKLEGQFAAARQQAALLRSRAGQVLASTPLRLHRVQALLPPGTVLVEYGVLNEGLTAFVVTRERARQLRWALQPDVLRKQIRRLRAALADAGSADWQPLIDSMSQAVWTPLSKLIPANARNLILVPAGELNYLPFQVLNGSGGTPLVDQYAISYLPSASMLEVLPARQPPLRQVFLGALGNLSIEGWAPLPGTLTETDGIAKLYPNGSRATEKQFTHDVARAALLNNDVVHFATHGVLDEHAPLFSALLTAGAAGQPSRLSLYELPALSIRARLVILSACETGLGKLTRGDEVSGLTRTFLLAGADTVVSSLWKVSDESTALLMREFHVRLQRGVRPSQALRESAIVVRKQFPHPFFWTPFVVTGAP